MGEMFSEDALVFTYLLQMDLARNEGANGPAVMAALREKHREIWARVAPWSEEPNQYSPYG